ncbi:MAG: hypothetical protein MHPSP_004310, partial [Paramarteilia canceri]
MVALSASEQACTLPGGFVYLTNIEKYTSKAQQISNSSSQTRQHTSSTSSKESQPLNAMEELLSKRVQSMSENSDKDS